MFDAVIYGLFIGLPLLMVLGVVVAFLRRRAQHFDDV